MKTKKTALILLIALAISTVSCVDNTVSPQVEAIRAQQVEWMKAKTALATADANFRKAQADFEAANNALIIKTKELDYNLAVATNASNLKQAEANLANAKANLQRALNDLAVSVANSGDIQAKEYLNNYVYEADALDNLYYSRVIIQNNIVNQKLTLSFQTEDLNIFLKQTQLTIDAEKENLVARKSALATFQAVIANPASLITEVNSLKNTITALTTANLALATDYLKAQIANDTAKMTLITNQQNTNTNTINSSNRVISSLNNSINNINNLKLVANAEVISITELENYLVTLTAQLKISTGAGAVAAIEANIARYTKELDSVNVAITAQEKIVAYWKGLLDKIFTA